jgi:hypothetical protein
MPIPPTSLAEELQDGKDLPPRTNDTVDLA